MKMPKSPELKRLRLRQLDERLTPWHPLSHQAPPRGGWIRAIRQALGMGITQLARRIGTKPSTAAEFEKREAAGTITLNSLRRMAKAMDATLVYALVPNSTLAATVREQALRKAHTTHGRVRHSMALEAQNVDAGEAGLQERELAEQLLMQWSRTLWDDSEESQHLGR